MEIDEEPRTNTIVVTPYTKRFGIAVFQRGELFYFGVRTFRRPRTVESISEETTEKLSDLLDRFKPILVIVKALTKHQARSFKHKEVVQTIKHTLSITGVPIKESSFEEARQRFGTEDKPPKASTFAILQKLYPELNRFVQFQNRYQSEYYTPMLAAIVIGVVHCQNKRQNRTTPLHGTTR